MINSHWALRSQHWNRSVPPLRYDSVALQTLKELIGDRTNKIVVLGVTRELVELFPNILAIDNEPTMLTNVWIGDTATKSAMLANWLEVNLESNTYSATIGDGSINQVAFPQDQKSLLTKIYDWLEPGGIFACRMYTRPDTPITREDLIREGITPTVNWSAYRRMLSMYLAEQHGQTIETKLITDPSFEDCISKIKEFFIECHKETESTEKIGSNRLFLFHNSFSPCKNVDCSSAI